MVAATVPEELVVTSRTVAGTAADGTKTLGGVIMGIQHRTLPIYGVQFHPESVLTSAGHQMLGNFLARCSR